MKELKHEDLKVGMYVKVTTGWGKVYKGTITFLYTGSDRGFKLGEEIIQDSAWDNQDFKVEWSGGETIEISKEEYTGKSVSYYSVDIKNPTSAKEPYIAECNDIIEALGMNYAEGNAFKSIWRRCAARKLGKSKKGYGSGLYDAEKGVFFAERILIQAQEEENAED